MRIIITGATGFIGKALSELLSKDYELVALTRDPVKANNLLKKLARPVKWDGKNLSSWAEEINGAYAVVNLAGENIATGRWTAQKKQMILNSRIDTIAALTDAMKASSSKPEVLIQTSGIGFYGPKADQIIDENCPAGAGFLADVAAKIEKTTNQIEISDLRKVIIRTGLVLGPDGGVLDRFVKAFKFYVGGYFGSGRQWFSWISLNDQVKAIRFLIERNDLERSFNLTAPHPVTMRQMCKTLANILHRPSWPIPALFPRVMFGQVAEEVLLSGQRVVPKRLQQAGFEFADTDLEKFLKSVLE